MKFKVVSKRLIYIDEGYNITKGENNNELITIEMPRYPNGTDTDYLSLSHRLTVTSVEDSTIAACEILIKEELNNDKIRLSCPVTRDITSVGKKAFFKVTSVGSNDFIDITECTVPIKINGNTDEDRFPSENDAEQLLNALQLAAQEAKKVAQDAQVIAREAFEAAQEAKNEAQKAEKASQNADNASKNAEKSAQDAANTTNELNSNAEETLVHQAKIKITINEIKSYIGYTDSDIIGLHADFENNIFTRLGAAVGLNSSSDFDKFPMYGGRRRCNVLDNGTITAYYGDSNFIEDGSNGQVMVYQPKFFYKVVPLKLDPQTDGIGYHLRKANYFISSTPKVGFKLHPAFYDESGNPVDYILFSAYEGSIFDTSENIYLQNDEQIADFAAGTGDKLSSIAGVKPCSGKSQNLTRNNAEQLAKNRGKGWHCDTIKAESANQMLMIIEYASFNTQSVIGMGVVNMLDDGENNMAIITGMTSFLGNTTGMADNENGKSSVSYKGMENPWGNIWKVIQGVNIYGNGKTKGGITYICNNYNFTENKSSDNYNSTNFTLANESGFITAFGYSESCDWLFFPSEISSNSNIQIGDYNWISNNLNGYRTCQFGGYWSCEIKSGFFCMALSNALIIHAISAED